MSQIIFFSLEYLFAFYYLSLSLFHLKANRYDHLYSLSLSEYKFLFKNLSNLRR